MSMWEPFTERARRSIVLAQEEAQRLGNNYIGTEHILLGIISEGESVAAKVLETLGVDLKKVRSEIEAIVGRGGKTVQEEMVFTPRAKRVIELAFEEARQLDHNYIGTEHLLLGVMREGEGVGARVLMNIGVDPANVRVQTLSRLAAEPLPELGQAVLLGSRLQHAPAPVRPAYLEQTLSTTTKHAIVAALEEAQRRRDPVCTSEHLVFGLAHLEDSAASQMLAQRGILVDVIRSHERTNAAAGAIGEHDVTLSSAAMNTVMDAVRQASSNASPKAKPEHLLLAIAMESDNVGAILLQSLGVDLAKLTKELTDHLKGDDEHDAR